MPEASWLSPFATVDWPRPSDERHGRPSKCQRARAIHAGAWNFVFRTPPRGAPRRDAPAARPRLIAARKGTLPARARPHGPSDHPWPAPRLNVRGCIDSLHQNNTSFRSSTRLRPSSRKRVDERKHKHVFYLRYIRDERCYCNLLCTIIMSFEENSFINSILILISITLFYLRTCDCTRDCLPHISFYKWYHKVYNNLTTLEAISHGKSLMRKRHY